MTQTHNPQWQGKTYWLIGASEGLGRALAKHLHAEGAGLILSARNEARLTSLQAELPGATVLALDVTDARAWEDLSEVITFEKGGDDLARLEEVRIKAGERLAAPERGMLSYALAKAYRDVGEQDVAAMKRDEAQHIPQDFTYEGLQGLSNELRLKLERAKPETLGQAARVEGMTPAALTLLLAKVRQAGRKSA